MKFEFNGNTYRIIFQHDKSRAWSDHLNHDVILAHVDIDAQLEADTKVIRLYCLNCDVIIGNKPKALRKRKTACIIQKERVSVGPNTGRELAAWVPVLKAYSVTRTEAGDVFNRKIGCAVSLENALETAGPVFRADTSAFCKAARKAYRNRNIRTKTATTAVDGAS